MIELQPSIKSITLNGIKLCITHTEKKVGGSTSSASAWALSLVRLSSCPDDWNPIHACDLQSWGALLACRRVPIVHHLCGDDGIECKSSDESVENKWIIDFLDSGEDTGKGSDEEVEDL